MTRAGRGRRRPRWTTVALLALPAAVAGATLLQPSAHAQPDADEELGAQLYASQCASCHAVDGTGIEGRGPSLEEEGAASTDFVLRTGRMPLPHPDMQSRRKPPSFDEEEIAALVAHVASIGTGPDIPRVDPEQGSLAAGSELYQLNCAACHVATGAGAVIGGGLEAPTLMRSTPTEVAEAIVVGPGAMPVFGAFDQQDLNDVAAYVQHLQEEGTTDAGALGGVGPVAEGLAAWLIGLVPLLAFCRWIGRPDPARDEADVEPGVET